MRRLHVLQTGAAALLRHGAGTRRPSPRRATRLLLAAAHSQGAVQTLGLPCGRATGSFCRAGESGRAARCFGGVSQRWRVSQCCSAPTSDRLRLRSGRRISLSSARVPSCLERQAEECSRPGCSRAERAAAAFAEARRRQVSQQHRAQARRQVQPPAPTRARAVAGQPRAVAISHGSRQG